MDELGARVDPGGRLWVAGCRAPEQTAQPQPNSFNSGRGVRRIRDDRREGAARGPHSCRAGGGDTTGAGAVLEPRAPVDMEKVRQVLKAQRVPGLALKDATDEDLAHLKGLTALQAARPVVYAGDGRRAGVSGGAERVAAPEPWRNAGDGRGSGASVGLAGLQYLNLEGTRVTGSGAGAPERADGA